MNVKSGIAGTLLALASTLAFAQPPAGGPGQMRLSPLFAALDTESDRILSPAELKTAPESLRKLDKNGDGQLTMDELRPAPPPNQQQGPSSADLVKTLLSFDKNDDGQLSKAEVPARMQGLFDRGDSNHDGILSKEELATLATAQKPPAEPVRQAREGEGRRPEGMRRGDPLHLALDLDGDGTISAAEIAQAATSLLKLDKNGDGSVSLDETRPAFGPGGPGGPNGADRRQPQQ